MPSAPSSNWITCKLMASLCAACTFVVLPNPVAGQSQFKDVATAFTALGETGVPLKFAPGSQSLPRGGHLQGIQVAFDPTRNRCLAFLSHDSETVSYLVIVEFPVDLSGPGRVIHVHELPSDGKSPPLRHAGGIQLVDNVLAVGLEDNQQRLRSEVQFWNVRDPARPEQLRHLTVPRNGPRQDKTAGAVGIVRGAADHLVAVGNWDSRAIDLYASNGRPLDDPTCRFELKTRWSDAAAAKDNWKPDARFGSYQAVNLMANESGNLFLAGFETRPDGAECADLFALDLKQSAANLLRKIASKQIKLSGDVHFRFAAGLATLREKLIVLASQRDIGTDPAIDVVR